MADVLDLPDLVKALIALDELEGLDRTRTARDLVAVARASVTAAGDQGAWEATRPRGALTRREAAAELGCAQSALDDAVSRHNARLRPVARKADRKRGR